MGYEPVPPFRRDFDAARDPYTARNALGITTLGGGGVPEAPNDGKVYGRKSLGWTDLATLYQPVGSYQPLDGDLTSLAAASGTNTIYYRSGTSTWTPVVVGTGLLFSGGTLSSTVSGGIGEAPNDGFAYLRGSLAWSSGGTLSGTLTIKPAAINASLVLNKPASGNANVISCMTNGSLRWTIQPGDATAETGSNAGSNFALYRYTDAGVAIDTPLQINRATGLITLGGGSPSNAWLLALSSGLSAGGGAADAGLAISAKGNGGTVFRSNCPGDGTITGGAVQFVVGSVAGATRFIQAQGSVAGDPMVSAQGGGNVALNVSPPANDNSTRIATTAFAFPRYGVTDGSNAVAGQIGEYLELVIGSGSAIPVANNAWTAATGLNLSPGDWDVTTYGILWTPTAATATFPYQANLSMTAAAAIIQFGSSAFSYVGFWSICFGPVRISTTTGNLVYINIFHLSGQADTKWFGTIRARRVR